MKKRLDPFNEGTWSDDERRYFEHVNEALECEEYKVISNGKAEHAAYIIHKFLTRARTTVRIFSGRLSRTYNGVSVYGNRHITKAAASFLAAEGRTLRIVLQDELDLHEGQTPADHPLVVAAQELQENRGLRGSLEIRQASKAAMDYLTENNYRNHWMIMDEHAYRLETNTEKAGAHVNFADPRTAGALAAIFDGLLYPDSSELVCIGR